MTRTGEPAQREDQPHQFHLPGNAQFAVCLLQEIPHRVLLASRCHRDLLDAAAGGQRHPALSPGQTQGLGYQISVKITLLFRIHDQRGRPDGRPAEVRRAVTHGVEVRRPRRRLPPAVVPAVVQRGILEGPGDRFVPAYQLPGSSELCAILA